MPIDSIHGNVTDGCGPIAGEVVDLGRAWWQRLPFWPTAIGIATLVVFLLLRMVPV